MEGTRSGLPLLAASARPRAGVLLAGCAVLVAVLGAVFARQNTADRFDHAVDVPVITWFAGHHALALWLAFPGSMIPAVVLTAALAIGCLLTGRRRGAVLAILAVPVAAVITDWLLKPLVHRTYIGQVVYPSGHTATIVALAATATVLLLAPPRPEMARPLRILSGCWPPRGNPDSIPAPSGPRSPRRTGTTSRPSRRPASAVSSAPAHARPE
jgi:undecaprenyl-diphosphatase